ncbi:hypothetical protein LF1_52030 [Rubripirellula obstinata]|uniref:Uncharacterized protein n=1 Tax=Rubripirellula obstinata TaxID=406547 RepID=A0A5B1CDC0_9BACT|nr:hypothetical protein [Rubripirellula obstinata]KAA1257354.1 hypothetical protein LF1_52030 [Rubripirellula obstinata]
MTNEHADWLTVEYPNFASFCIPPDATHELIDDDSTICVTHKATDVLASLYPLRQSLSACNDSLELELRDFTDRCIRPRAEIDTVSYEPPVDVDFTGIACIQSVLTIGDNRIWLARAYARIGGDQMMLIHWNGPRELAPDFPMGLFVSLVPLFATQYGG